MPVRIMIASGITAAVISFFVLSAREDDLGAALAGAVGVAIIVVGLVAVWGWAL